MKYRLYSIILLIIRTLLYITKIHENSHCDVVLLVIVRKVVATTDCGGPWWTTSTTRWGWENELEKM